MDPPNVIQNESDNPSTSLENLNEQVVQKGDKEDGKIMNFIYFCIGALIILAPLTVVCSCMLIIALAILALSVISLLVARFLQFIRHAPHGDGNDKLGKFKHVIRQWLFIEVIIVVILLWCLFPFAKYVPCLKKVMVFDLPFTKWIVIISVMCGLYSLSFFVYLFGHYEAIYYSNVRGMINIIRAVAEIVDSLIFWWAEYEVMKRVPSLRQSAILGLPFPMWIKVTVLILIGCNLLTLFVHITVFILRYICQNGDQIFHNGTIINFLQHHTNYLVYFVNGIKWSVCFILSSLLLLLTWILYFGTHLDIMNSKKAKSIWELGKWTFLSLLISSFLCFVKTIVLLAWEFHTVYDRLKTRILPISKRLYFLHILGWDKHIETSQDGDLRKKEDLMRDREKAKSILLTLKDPTMDDIQLASEYFLNAKNVLSMETYISDILNNFNDSTGDNSKNLEKLFSFEKILPGEKGSILTERKTMEKRNAKENHVEKENREDDKQGVVQSSNQSPRESRVEEEKKDQKERVAQISTVNSMECCVEIEEENRLDEEEGLVQSSAENPREEQNKVDEEQHDGEETSLSKHGMWEDDWKIFVGMLQEIKRNDHTEFSSSNIQTWVERAHNQCMFLANTLSSAKAVSGTLNMVISWLLLGATIVMWLLLTGLATTKVLVLLASPLLAATFIFGNTCKTLFEGILFVYVVHPFDIGDLCVVDDKMMEVIAIGVWTTAFTKVDKFGTQEVVIHPNLDLAKKIIVNHKTVFDWSDRAEFNLGSVKTTNITKQEEVISFVNRHLESGKCGFLSSSPDLTVSGIGDSFKLAIRLKYNVENTTGWMYSECVRKKDQLQGDFHVFMQDVIRKFQAEYTKGEEVQEGIKDKSLEAEIAKEKLTGQLKITESSSPEENEAGGPSSRNPLEAYED